MNPLDDGKNYFCDGMNPLDDGKNDFCDRMNSLDDGKNDFCDRMNPLDDGKNDFGDKRRSFTIWCVNSKKSIIKRLEKGECTLHWVKLIEKYYKHRGLIQFLSDYEINSVEE